MDENSANCRDALVPFGVISGHVAAIVLGLLAGLPGAHFGVAAAGAAVGIGAEAVAFVNDHRKRRADAQVSRLKSTCKRLEDRLGDVEVKLDDEKLDLLVEVVRKELEDDEERKGLFYAAVLEWILRESPNSTAARILSDGVRQLAYVELYCILWELNTKRHARPVLEKEGLAEGLWIQRVAMHGLGQEGVRHIGSSTRLSAVLEKYVKFAELPPPNAAAKTD
ncbi:MAG TPA: hypothetical protein VG797_02455 [Phycisphaerales bacterium]|nr:hypothetical protein [Phycisphaerales bacterium]